MSVAGLGLIRSGEYGWSSALSRLARASCEGRTRLGVVSYRLVSDVELGTRAQGLSAAVVAHADGAEGGGVVMCE